MNKKFVNTLYEKLMTLDNGVQQIKFDLHIHSPASKDFCGSSKKTELECFQAILNESIANELRIIAITDHNTFAGYNKIKDIINKDNRYKDILVLCGIEITCFSKHFLAIFDESFPEEKQGQFLREIELNGNDGTEAITPFKLIEVVGHYGGFVILAHADDKNGFLQHLCKSKDNSYTFSSTSTINILNYNYLCGIQINSESNKDRLKEVFSNKEYKDAKKLPFLKFSDAHGIVIDNEYSASSGKQIGSAYSVIKLSEITYKALKMAFRDGRMRILSNMQNPNYSYILGVAIKGSFFKTNYEDFSLIRLHEGLNCLIGGRGTGKSTFLKLLMYIFSLGKNIEKLEQVPEFDEAVIFILFKSDIYAVCCCPKNTVDDYTRELENHCLDIKVLKKKSATSKVFVPTDSNMKYKILEYISTGYSQGELSDFRKDNFNKIVEEFLKWKYQREFGDTIKSIIHQRNELSEIFSKLDLDKNMIDELEDQELLNTVIKIQSLILKEITKQYDLYDKMIKHINQLVIGKVKMNMSIDFSEHEDFLTDCHNNRNLPTRISKSCNKNFEYTVKVSRIFKQVLEIAKHTPDFKFFQLIFEQKFEQIIEAYNFKNLLTQNLAITEIHQILKDIHKNIDKDIITIFPKIKVTMEANINHNNYGEEIYRDSKRLSLGQNAVALLTLILDAANSIGDSRTLLMDQPEDDIDNKFIYETLVNEFRKVKHKRQIIISTHNANIPVAADAENVLVLEFDGRNGYIARNGSLDSQSIAESIIDTLEGGENAIKQRYSKYEAIRL